MIDHYRVLGIPRTSSTDDIKKAYKKLAMKYHPDRNKDPSAESTFKQIKESYEYLSNPPKPTFTFTQHPNTKKATYLVKVSLEQAYNGTTTHVNGIPVTIPKGIRTGNKLFLNALIVEIEVLSHSKYKRSQDDLLVDVSISAIEAMLGVEVVLTHIDNKKFKFTIHEGIQPGQVMKLQGKGMPNPESNRFGDLLIRVNILIPRLTNDEKCSIMNIQKRNCIEI